MSPSPLCSGAMTNSQTTTTIPPSQRDELLHKWATWMRAQSWSERTIADRLALVSRVAAGAGQDAALLTTDDVLAFLSGSTFSASSRQTYYASLKAWFLWLTLSEIRADNPMRGVRKPRAGRRTPRHLRTEHVVHLLQSGIHARTRTMVLLMAYQGLRVFEVAKFRGDEIDRISGEVEIVGKGGVQAILPLHPIIGAEAAKYGQGWWFPQWTSNHVSPAGGHILGASVTSIVSAAMKRAGVPGTAHSLRHWHATEMLRAGLDSRITQELMRHASLATTERYLHVDDTQRRNGLMLLPDVTGSARVADLPQAA